MRAFAIVLQLVLIPHVLLADGITLMNSEFLDQYAATRRFSLGKPTAIRFAGDRVLFLRSGPRSPVQDLFEFDPKTGQERVLITADQLLGGQTEELTADELARRERMRMGSRGIASYSLSDDETKILFPLSGRLFLLDLSSGKSSEIKGDGGYPIDPQLSLDAQKLACVRDHELFVIDVGSGKQTRLTHDAGGDITNGEAEFVAQEEMHRHSGYWWSPDGSKIAYEQVDTSGVERFHIADPSNAAKEPQSWPYPRAGCQNATTKLGIVSSSGGETTWVKWDRDKYPYLATVRWAKNSSLVILVQNREQTEEILCSVNAETGSTTELLKETDTAWLNLRQSCPKWLEDGSAFLWMTERGGAWQLELRGRDGKLIDTLTSKDLGLRDVIDIDDKGGVVYVSASTDPTQSHVWSVPLQRSTPKPLTKDPGHHGAAFPKNHQWRVLTSSTATRDAEWNVCRADGTPVGSLNSVAEKPNITPAFDVARVTEKHFPASLVRPRDFDSAKKYPVIVGVYGGPGGGVVGMSRDGYLHAQWLADQGFIVCGFDGRGLNDGGREWERITKNNFIDIPLEDQVTALKALAADHPEMDIDRVGITGWSFGGYFTAMAVMRRPDVFKCGVAGAPVVDCADYDTHYTERYLSTPETNPDGYRACNVLTWAKDLSRPLLIIHGTADDNVYFMNSLKLTDALVRAGKPFEFMPLSGQTHSVRDPAITKSVELRSVEFFKRNLGEQK